MERETVEENPPSNNNNNLKAFAGIVNEITERRAKENVCGYETINQLGYGSFGRVYRVQKNGVSYALKEGHNGLQEIDIMSRLIHPHLQTIVDILSPHRPNCDVMSLSIVTPLASGDAFSLITLPHPPSKYLLIKGLYQIFTAVSFLHQAKILHLDIKPENILYQGTPSDPHLFILTDFGVSQYVDNVDIGRYINNILVTTTYRSPELLEDTLAESLNREDNAINLIRYNGAVDVWTLGITTLVTLTGRLIYDYTSSKPSPKLIFDQAAEMFAHKEKEEYIRDFLSSNKVPADIVKEAIPFLSDILQWNPDDRPRVQELLDYSFFKVGYAHKEVNPNISNPSPPTKKLLKGFKSSPSKASSPSRSSSSSPTTNIINRITKVPKISKIPQKEKEKERVEVILPPKIEGSQRIVRQEQFKPSLLDDPSFIERVKRGAEWVLGRLVSQFDPLPLDTLFLAVDLYYRGILALSKQPSVNVTIYGSSNIRSPPSPSSIKEYSFNERNIILIGATAIYMATELMDNEYLTLEGGYSIDVANTPIPKRPAYGFNRLLYGDNNGDIDIEERVDRGDTRGIENPWLRIEMVASLKDVFIELWRGIIYRPYLFYYFDSIQEYIMAYEVLISPREYLIVDIGAYKLLIDDEFEGQHNRPIAITIQQYYQKLTTSISSPDNIQYFPEVEEEGEEEEEDNDEEEE